MKKIIVPLTNSQPIENNENLLEPRDAGKSGVDRLTHSEITNVMQEDDNYAFYIEVQCNIQNN
jgi:hypothetical protein